MKAKLPIARIDSIFLTHLHGDHCFGIFALIRSMSLSGRKSKLNVISPKGIKTMMDSVFSSSHSNINFLINYYELTPSVVDPFKETPIQISYKLDHCDDDDLVDEDNSNNKNKNNKEKGNKNVSENDFEKKNNISVKSMKLEHRVESYGFVFKEFDRLGKLDIQKLKEEGILPGPIYGKLQNGIDVELEEGRVIKSADYLGPMILGKKVVIFGDNANDKIDYEEAKNANIMVHEVTYDSLSYEKAISRGHSTSTMTGRLAHSLQPDLLFITHFGASYLYSTHSDELSSDNNNNNNNNNK